MGRRTKTRKSYRLSQRIKYEDTKPELVVDALLADLRCYPVLKGVGIDVRDEEGKLWTIFPDKRIDFNTMVEVDGIYHDTPIQRRKTVWRDGLLTKAGYRVIHVDAELTKNKVHQNYLKDKLAEAINSKESVVRIDA